MWFSLHGVTEESGKGADEDVGTRRDALLPIGWSQDAIYQVVKKADLFFRSNICFFIWRMAAQKLL